MTSRALRHSILTASLAASLALPAVARPAPIRLVAGGSTAGPGTADPEEGVDPDGDASTQIDREGKAVLSNRITIDPNG